MSSETRTDCLPGRGPALVQIGLVTGGILALELALIRWLSGQVRVLAYFNNLILIASFFGMGIGLVVGRRRPELVHWTLPALAALAIPVGLAPELGLADLRFPDPAIFLWGAEATTATAGRVLLAAGLILALFAAVVAVFAFAASLAGALFARVRGNPGYSADLLGSLLGVLAMTAVTATGAPPLVWFALGGLPFVWLSRRVVSVLGFATVLALTWHSARGAAFSPYNRIDLETTPWGLTLSTNRDFHQYMHDFSGAAMAAEDRDSPRWKMMQMYKIPFILRPGASSCLVVGGGTGNDVAAALRMGVQRVTSVDIDGSIIDFGRRLHPEAPYSDPRVTAVVNDARAFFEQHQGPPFDLVVYGFVDSHAMFSSLSTLRLDNYLYTVEALRGAWRLVGPDGLLSVNLSMAAGDWMYRRLYWTIAAATGSNPVVFQHGLHLGATFVVARRPEALSWQKVRAFPVTAEPPTRAGVTTTSDDWPFLYLQPGVVPWGYLLVLSAVLLGALLTTYRVFGRDRLARGFQLPLFLMGAAFLLIETRAITSLSLLFGSTWVVNAVVFGGVLVVALLANLAVQRRPPRSPGVLFALLFAAVALLWLFKTAWLAPLPILLRGVLGGLVNALPVGFAGLLVSTFIARSGNAAGAIGSNLLGSVVGGALEYLSMYVGIRGLVLVALALYLGAFATSTRLVADAPAPAPDSA